MSSMRRMICSASASMRFVMSSTNHAPPSGSIVLATPLSSAMICWVRSAIVTESSVGSA
jgi:hypothetical protein